MHPQQIAAANGAKDAAVPRAPRGAGAVISQALRVRGREGADEFSPGRQAAHRLATPVDDATPAARIGMGAPAFPPCGDAFPRERRPIPLCV
jgi:hypothetical protein